ncbi:hypothetical protein CHUAL_009116 [Chamberlinius hualienensis]
MVAVTSILPLAILAPLSALLYYYNVEPPKFKVVKRGLADHYDFIVVGAGSAGAVVASRLSEDPSVRVLLLEAGGDETFLSEIPALSGYLQLSELDWQYKTTPQQLACLGFKNRQCSWPRGKVLGGSSTINYLVYIRGNRRDYDLWASLGNYGWSYNEVLPYFLKSEDNTSPWMAHDVVHHHTGGYLTISEVPYRTPLITAFLQAGRENGYPTRDLNGEFQSGVMPVQATLRRGARCSTAKAFLRPAMNRPNLHIIMNAHALKVQLDNRKRAYGVVFDRFGREHFAKASKEVILAAGAINTPQLLMLSGIGPKAHLQEHGIPVIVDLPGVGENLQDHVASGGITWTVDYPVSVVQTRLETPSYILEWMIHGKGPLTTLGGLEGAAFVKTPFTNQSDDWPDVQFHYVSGSAVSDRGKHLRYITGFTDEVWDKYYLPIINKDTFSMMPTLLRPKSRGTVRLKNADPFEPPLMDPKYFTHPEDIHTITEGAKIALAFGRSAAFQKFGAKLHSAVFPGCESFELHSEEYFACLARHYSATIYHPVGTCKMGVAEDPMAVVDPELRVYKVTGLRVVDASIMPLINSGNTNGPVIMIGEKAADMIKMFWNLKR